jgi:hypothetical protein
VREQLLAGVTDRHRLARDVRRRTRATLTLLEHGLGEFTPKR